VLLFSYPRVANRCLAEWRMRSRDDSGAAMVIVARVNAKR
jgi:hypothetical protein